jgi:oxygen-dependent protoporphyrinogen oxidase
VIVVVGGGIAGLAAAHRLVHRGAPVTLVEQSAELGGKLRTGELAGGPVETGAEMFLTRDPDGADSAAVELARALGLGPALAYPATTRAAIAIGGALRPIPGGTLLGVPGDLSTLDDIAVVDTALDRDGGRPLLGPDDDTGVGTLVRRRLGDQVADRLVDPMLGGVYAGRADDLSLAATIPVLADACRMESTLVAAVRAALATRPPSLGQVFATVVGGLGRLVDALVSDLRSHGAELRLGVPVRAVQRRGARWRLILGSARDPAALDADAVVLAVPARPAARLLSTVDEASAKALGVLDYASVALVTVALPAVELPDLSGFLVPATEGYAVKAATFFTRKWAHLVRPDATVLVRASIGRYREEAVLHRTDADLVDLVRAELAALLKQAPVSGRLPAPIDAFVQRWGGALPQYTPGHVARVELVRSRLPASLALAGAALDGVGIAACVRSGWRAGDQVLAGLEQWNP